MKHWQRLISYTVLLLLLGSAVAQALGYYDTTASTRTGMLVSSSPNADVVEPATTANVAKILGVVGLEPTTATQQSSLQLGQVNVISDGEINALVSNVHGDIKVGDRITASELQGIGAKSTKNEWVVGVAQASFDNRSSGAVQSSVTDSRGKQRSVAVGQIPIIVRVTYYNASTGKANDSIKDSNTIQALADKIAGQQASELGILLSFIVLFVGLIIVGTSVNTIIKGGITAIGRQPLIRSYLMRTIAMALAVTTLILFAVFLAAFMLLRIV